MIQKITQNNGNFWTVNLIMRAKIVNQSLYFPVRRTGSYRHKKLALVISLNLVNRVDPWRNLCTNLLHFVVRVRCHRKESSRSLSHLRVSFLFIKRLVKMVCFEAFLVCNCAFTDKLRLENRLRLWCIKLLQVDWGRKRATGGGVVQFNVVKDVAFRPDGHVS